MTEENSQLLKTTNIFNSVCIITNYFNSFCLARQCFLCWMDMFTYYRLVQSIAE